VVPREVGIQDGMEAISGQPVVFENSFLLHDEASALPPVGFDDDVVAEDLVDDGLPDALSLPKNYLLAVALTSMMA